MASFYADVPNHKYYIDGLQVPSVTDVCKQLTDFSQVPAFRLEYKSQLGQAVHKAIELMHEDNLDMDTVADAIKPYIAAYEKFIVDTKFIAKEFELFVWSERYRYAGRLDLIGQLNDKRALVDLKTVTTLHPATALQTAAYAHAAEESLGSEYKSFLRYALQLNPNGTYRLVEYSNANDLHAFFCALQLHNWRLQNGCA